MSKELNSENSEFNTGYKMGVNEALGEIQKLRAQVKEMKAILKDFLTTNEDTRTWLEEMHSTIEAVINE